VDMILLDWTRMGKTFCVAGAVVQGGQYHVVRPLSVHFRDAPVRNVGWSAYQLAGHARWDVFELIGPKPAAAVPPHLEDIWVRTLAPCAARPRRSNVKPSWPRPLSRRASRSSARRSRPRAPRVISNREAGSGAWPPSSSRAARLPSEVAAVPAPRNLICGSRFLSRNWGNGCCRAKTTNCYPKLN